MQKSSDKKSSKNKFTAFFLKIKNDFRKNWKYLLWAVVAFAVLHLIAVVALIISINYGLFGPLPDKYQLRNIEHPVASKIFTADSVMMGKYYAQNRLDLEPDEVKSEIIDALIATEDIRFYNHNGIDVKSLFRVAIKTIMLQKDNSGGGSTITQQLAKNLYPRKEYMAGSLVINKLREMVIAVKLEKYYTKRQILLLYLNTVPFGENTYGIKAGALRYFHKNPTELKTEETATMVGMLKGTTLYNPRRNYDNALHRRNVVLLQMNKYGYLGEEVADSLSNLPIELNYYRFNSEKKVAPYYSAKMRPEVESILESVNKKTGLQYDLDTDGLTIYTTVDSRLQKYAEEAVKQNLREIQKTLNKQWENTNWEQHSKIWPVIRKKLENIDEDSLHVKRETKIFDWEKGEKDTIMTPVEKAVHDIKLLQSGFIAMENKTGNIMAWVGGINHELFQYDHVTARRQAGSTFKPFLYLAALEAGFRPCDIFDNRRYKYANFEGWSPRNSDNQYKGMYTLKGALSNSVNTISATLISDVGVSKVIETARRAGINSHLPNVPSLALGTAELSLLELVSSYQTLANKGQKVDPNYVSHIIDNEGDVIYRNTPASSGRYDSYAPDHDIETLIAMLKNVVTQGTAARLRYRYNIYTDVAGKTGTTQNYADGWFIGFTPDITAGAWVGADYPAIRFKTKFGQGSYTALPIWASFFDKIYKDERYTELKNSRFSLPSSVASRLDCEDYIELPDIKIIEVDPIRSMESIKEIEGIGEEVNTEEEVDIERVEKIDAISTEELELKEIDLN